MLTRPAAPAFAAALMHPAVKPLVFLACLLPLFSLVAGIALGRLGANPAEALIRSTGDWTLRMLCVVLAVTPLRELTGMAALARLRRMTGLFVFFYALLHALAYAWFDMGLVAADIVRDIAKRPFILVGFCALCLLLLLACTSFDRAVRALGARRWRRLHLGVHAIGVLALLHFFWMRAGKNDFFEVGVYALVLGALWTWRLARLWRRRSLSAAARPGPHGPAANGLPPERGDRSR